MVEAVNADNTYSHLWATSFSGKTLNYRYACTDTEDERCNKPDFYEFLSVLPVCSDNYVVDCIEKLSAIKSDGTQVTAKFNRYTLPDDPDNFTTRSSLFIPKTASASVWNIPGAMHAQGDDYAVLVTVSGERYAGQESNNRNNDKFEVHLYPVSTLKNAVWSNSGCSSLGMTEKSGKYALKKCHALDFNYKNPESPKCALLDGNNGDCLVAEAFPADTTFSLKIRLSSSPNGWFHGRIDSPSIDLVTDSSSTNLTVTAKPVRVPVFAQSGLWSDLSEYVKNFWLEDVTQCPTKQNCGVGMATNPVSPYNREGMEKTMTAINQYPYGEFALKAVKVFAEELKDRPSAAPSVWAFRSLENSWKTANTPEYRCINQGVGLKGIVSTNSTAYAEGAPTFSDGFLNYKVSSFHNLPDGSVFKGSYDLILRSDVARCLYAFTKAPVSAKIEIVSENGQPQIATTTMVEKNDWIYLSAKNFTFSSPVVKVKLLQEAKSPEPTASPNPTTSSAPAKVLTKKITCVKGKTKKVISGAKPTCPKGYRIA